MRRGEGAREAADRQRRDERGDRRVRDAVERERGGDGQQRRILAPVVGVRVYRIEQPAHPVHPIRDALVHVRADLVTDLQVQLTRGFRRDDHIHRDRPRLLGWADVVRRPGGRSRALLDPDVLQVVRVRGELESEQRPIALLRHALDGRGLHDPGGRADKTPQGLIKILPGEHEVRVQVAVQLIQVGRRVGAPVFREVAEGLERPTDRADGLELRGQLRGRLPLDEPWDDRRERKREQGDQRHQHGCRRPHPDPARHESAGIPSLSHQLSALSVPDPLAARCGPVP